MTYEELENEQFVANRAQLVSDNASFIVPACNYNVKQDKRLLIPFVQNHKIGFVNREGVEIVKPKFDCYTGECYKESDFIEVGIIYGYAYERKNRVPEVYIRQKWGLLDSQGKLVLEPNYSGIIISANAVIVRRAYGHEYDGSHSLLNSNFETIVPFGVYRDIEPFENGLSRCRNHIWIEGKRKEVFSVINEQGEIILKESERNILPFYGKYKKRYLPYLKEIMRKENPEKTAEYFPVNLN